MFLYIIFGIIGAIFLTATIYINASPQMGGKSNKFDSPNFKDNKFQNLEPTSIMTSKYSMLKSMKEFFFDRSKDTFPKNTLQTKKINLDLIKKSNITVTWLGHSTILFTTKDLVIITDPVLNKKRIPPLNLGPKHFPYSNNYEVKDLPEVDIVLISHDHFDHLDMETVKKLKNSTFYVPLGVKSHLLRWGINEKNIKEHDWYNKTKHKNAEMIFTPARHFSGRGLFNRDSTLWGSWIIKINKKNIYYGGDSGYMKEFKKIGKDYGPFDIVMLDSGQYDKAWQPIHMLPNQVIKATIDLKGKTVLPIHNSKYVLSRHAWYDPMEKVTKEGKKRNVSVSTPKIGQTFKLGQKSLNDKWWRK